MTPGYIFMMIFAGVGAGAILFALPFVSAVIGGLVNAMIVLIAGPLIDRFVARRQARLAARSARG